MLELGLVLGETEIVELVEVEAGVVWKEDVLLGSWLRWCWSWLSFVGGGAQIWLSEEFHLVFRVTWGFVFICFLIEMSLACGRREIWLAVE